MQTKRVITAIILTLVFLVIARRLSTRHPESLSSDAAGIRLEHRSVTEQVEGRDITFTAKLHGDPSLQVNIKYGSSTQAMERQTTMARVADSLSAVLPGGQRGDRIYYTLTVTDSAGSTLTTLPGSNTPALLIKIKGEVAGWLLVAHILCMFASFFFVALAGLGAVELLRGAGQVEVLVRNSLWALNLIFIGGFPLGMAVAYQAFGVAWGGIPYGWDITDNKTLITFLFWLVAVLAGLRGLRHGGPAKADNHLRYAMLVMLCVVVTLSVYLIPHSL